MARRSILFFAIGVVLLLAAWGGAVLWVVNRAGNGRHEGFLALREKVLVGLANQFDQPPADLKAITPQYPREHLLHPGREHILRVLRGARNEWFQSSNDARVYQIDNEALKTRTASELAAELISHCEAPMRQWLTGHMSSSSLAGGAVVQQSSWSSADHDIAVLLRVEVDDQKKQARIERWVIEQHR